jgi:hypothetical protein
MWLSNIIIILRTSLIMVYNKKNVVKIDTQNLEGTVAKHIIYQWFLQGTVTKWLCYFFGSDINFFAPINNICSHGLPISLFVNFNPTF